MDRPNHWRGSSKKRNGPDRSAAASRAEYFTKSADRYPPERDRLLTDAAQFRAGVMPISYQYSEARR